MGGGQELAKNYIKIAFLTHYIWKLLEAAIFDHKINLDLDYVVSFALRSLRSHSF